MRLISGVRAVRLAALLVALGMTAAAPVQAASKKSTRARAFSLKSPTAGDISIARVQIKVSLGKAKHGARPAPRVLRFRLVNRSRLPSSLFVLAAGRPVGARKAVLARLLRRTKQTATFVTYVALLNRRPGAGAHARAAGGPLPSAIFEVSEGQASVIIKVTLYRNILGHNSQGKPAECRAGDTVDFVFSRADYRELAGAMGLSPLSLEKLFRAAVQACLDVPDPVDSMELDSVLNISQAGPPAPAPFTCSGGISINQPDPNQFSLHGSCNRALRGVQLWAPPGVTFTQCDPAPTCSIGGYNGGANNSVYFQGSLTPGAPFPAGWNVEQNKRVSSGDAYQLQGWAPDGSRSAFSSIHLGG